MSGNVVFNFSRFIVQGGKLERSLNGVPIYLIHPNFYSHKQVYLFSNFLYILIEKTFQRSCVFIVNWIFRYSHYFFSLLFQILANVSWSLTFVCSALVEQKCNNFDHKVILPSIYRKLSGQKNMLNYSTECNKQNSGYNK